MNDRKSSMRSPMGVMLSANGRIWSTFLLALIGSIVAAPLASAADVHSVDPTQFSTPASSIGGIAVRSSSDDVVVSDPGANEVVRLSRSGDVKATFSTAASVTSPTKVGFDPTSGEIWVAGADPANPSVGKVVRFSASGQPTVALNTSTVPGGNGLGPIGGLGVGPDGTVYVSDQATNFVEKFSRTGQRTGRLGGPGTSDGQFGSVGDVAVDGGGRVYVVEPFYRVQQFNGATGGFTRILAVSNPDLVAADNSSDDVYIHGADPAGNAGIDHFGAAGLRREFIRYSNGVVALGIDAQTADLFVGESFGVSRFAAQNGAGVDTLPSAELGPRTRELRGTVDPDGLPTSYYFEYSDIFDPTDYRRTPTENAGSGTSPISVSAPTGVLRNNGKSYSYRLVTQSGSVASFGPSQTLARTPAPPIIENERELFLTDVSVTLQAELDSPSSSSLEYGETTGYGRTTPERSFVPDSGSNPDKQTLDERLSGLKPGTTYHWRAISTNGQGTTVGPDQTFTTAPTRPTVVATAPTEISGSSARLNGVIDTKGLPATYQFTVLGINSPYSFTTVPVSIGAASGSRVVSSVISGLPNAGTFIVRLTVTTSTYTLTSTSDPVFASALTDVSVLPRTAPLGDPYACRRPTLAAPKGTLTVGATATLVGSDLGLQGTVLFDGRRAVVKEYSPSRVSLVVPSGLGKSARITASCATVSNSVVARLLVLKRIVATRVSVRGRRASVVVRVPAAGKTRLSAAGLGSAVATSKRAESRKLTFVVGKRTSARLARGTTVRVRASIRFAASDGVRQKRGQLLTLKVQGRRR